MALIVRPPRDDVELVACQEVEVAAGRLFAEIGLDEIAAAPPDDLATLRGHRERRHRSGWRCVGQEVVGYAMVSVVDEEGHLDQVSVRPEHGRRGVGTALLEQARAWAVERGFHAMTLTTFRDVAWNGPYYAKLGFEPLAETDLGPALQAIRDQEQADGLDVLPRQAMRCRAASSSSWARSRRAGAGRRVPARRRGTARRPRWTRRGPARSPTPG